jgi:DNA-binding transcriptional LysR family regulator
MNIDLHQLAVFVEVSRTRNVARAAENLGLTPSPVSRTLRTLEHRTGPLFHRAHHDMQLTEHGRALLGTAVSILQLSRVFEDKAAGVERTLRYGATPWVPDSYADAFRTAVGLSGITPEDTASEVSVTLLEKLRFGEIDMALVHLPVDLPDISSLALGNYTFDLMAAADDPLVRIAADGPVPLAALRGRQVVTLPFSQMQPDSGSNVRDWFIQAGVTDITEVTFSDYAVLTSRLARTHEISIGARGHSLSQVRGTDGKVVMLPVKDPQPQFEIGVVWRSAATARREEIDRVVAALTDRFRN